MDNVVKGRETSTTEDLPFVSVLMVNYNGMAHVKEFLESAFELNYPRDKYEVVVVDNASSDGSPEWIKENYPQVKLARLDKNYGFQVANNTGARDYCRGRFIAFQNSDVVLDRDWLIELVKAAVKDPAAIYGSKMLWYHRRDYIVYGGGRLFAWGEAFHLNTYARDSDNEVQPSLTMYADGCGFLVARKVYLDLGGFDESYWAYSDDIELSWRAWLLGYQIYFVPTAKFYHKVSASYGMRSHTQIYYLLRNQMRNIIKFAELPTLVTMFPSFITYYFVLYLAVFCFQEKRFSLILPILKACFGILVEFPSLMGIRRTYQKKRKRRARELKRLGLILSFGQSVSEALNTFRRKDRFWRGVGA